jgi:hypothetical protein
VFTSYGGSQVNVDNREQHGAMCLGYSEKEHGSDLIASGVTATKVTGGYPPQRGKMADQSRHHFWH